MPTETEAKAMWCPFARVPDAVNRETPVCAANRAYSGIVKDSHLCIGTECMAWRWANHSAKANRQFVELATGSPAPVNIEPIRPANVPPTWVWHPGGSLSGGYFSPGWRETEAEAEARFRAERQGTCGLAGRLA